MRLHRIGPRSGLAPSLGLLLLSVLWALGSLEKELFPHFDADTLPPAPRQALFYSVFAALAASVALVRGIPFPRGRQAWVSTGIGIGLFVLPGALVACAQDWVSTLDRVAIFSLTPVFTVVLEPYLEDSAARQGKAALAGALAGVAGILCLFPLDIPGSFRAGAALCALLAAAVSIAATNCLAVKFARNLASCSTLPMAAQSAAASAICFVTATAFTHHVAWRWSRLASQLLSLLVIELPALFLVFWLMRRLAASRMTARFLLAPLFAILAGMALEATFPPTRAWFGMVLLAGGAGWLVFAPAQKTEVDELQSLNSVEADSPRHSPSE